MKETVALFHPGEMGAAVGACLVRRGHRVVWGSEGRSEATRARAGAAGIEDRKSLERALEGAGVVLSVCPPHGAIELARAVTGKGFGGIYLDANAISPESTRAIGRLVEAAGARYVDGGIVGAPPAPGVRSRLYLSGEPAGELAALFSGTELEAVPLDARVGAASALKVCYAAWTKGATALLAGIRVLAQHEGVEAALLEEWKRSHPELAKRSEHVAISARKAWRWIGEMEEIGASFAQAGMPPGFHLAAAEIYRGLEAFKDRTTPPSLDEVTTALRRGR